MELTELISLSLFATVAAFTPGPNNLLLAASSANFGLRATWPHMAGVIIGFTLLVAISAFSAKLRRGRCDLSKRFYFSGLTPRASL